MRVKVDANRHASCGGGFQRAQHLLRRYQIDLAVQSVLRSIDERDERDHTVLRLDHEL
jgi:hypothetical protein